MHSKQKESKILINVGGRNHWNEEYLKKAQFLSKLSGLELKVLEYKALLIEVAKYKHIVNYLTQKGILAYVERR